MLTGSQVQKCAASLPGPFHLVVPVYDLESSQVEDLLADLRKAHWAAMVRRGPAGDEIVITDGFDDA